MKKISEKRKRQMFEQFKNEKTTVADLALQEQLQIPEVWTILAQMMESSQSLSTDQEAQPSDTIDDDGDDEGPLFDDDMGV